MAAAGPHTPSVEVRQRVPDPLLRLADRQGGVVSREQAIAHGLSRHALPRLVATGLWQPVARGLFLVGAGEPSWEGLAWGGLLVGGDRSRLGPNASGFLHRLESKPPMPIDVLVPLERVVRATGPWQFHRERPPASSRTVGAPDRLTVEDTVLDLCGLSAEHEVVTLVATVVSGRRTTASRLLRQLSQRARHPHRRLLRELLGDVRVGAESPIELRYLNDVERPHGLPKGDRQQSRLGLPYCSDVGYDECQLLVELDGRADHEGVGRFRDMRRDNRFAFRDWLTLRYGWFDLTYRPCVMAFEVAAMLGRRGWTGLPARCPRCLNADFVA